MKNIMDIDKWIFRGFCATFFLIPLGTSPFLITGYLTLAFWVLSGRPVAQRHDLMRQPWVAPLMLFAALHWAGLIYTSDLRTGLDFASKTHYWLFAFAMASVPFERYKPKAFIDSFLAGLSVAALLHIGINAGLVPAPQRYASSFINPITYILLLTFGMLMLSHYFARASDTGKRALYVAGILLYLASVSLFAGAPGRTALLTLVVSTPLAFYNLLGQKSFPKVLGGTVLAVVAFFATPVVQSSIADAASQVSDYYGGGSPASSMGLRMHMWSGAVGIIADNPLTGTGTGGYMEAMRAYATPAMEGLSFSQPHNSFLYMTVSFGAAGALSIAWLLAQHISAGWRRMDSVAGFSVLSFAVIVTVASLTDTQIIQVHTGVLLAMVTGFQAALKPATAAAEAPDGALAGSAA